MLVGEVRTSAASATGGPARAGFNKTQWMSNVRGVPHTMHFANRIAYKEPSIKNVKHISRRPRTHLGLFSSNEREDTFWFHIIKIFIAQRWTRNYSLILASVATS